MAPSEDDLLRPATTSPVLGETAPNSHRAPSLVLGRGVPDAWLRPGARFGVRSMPTERGVVSYEARVGADRTVQLSYEGPDQYRCEWRKD